MAVRIGMNHQDDEDSKSNRPVSQPPVEETKSLLVRKTAPKQTATGSKKLYIHNNFTRARSGAGDRMEEGGEQAELTICMDALVSKAPIIPLAPLPGTISASASTRTEYTQEQEQDQGPKPKQEQEKEQDSSGSGSFGMGYSIIGELFVLADTGLEKGWDSFNGRINDKNENKNTACEGNRRSNMLLMSLEHEHEYEPEILGPTSKRGRDELEMGQGKTEPLSENNRIRVVEIKVHQQNRLQVDVVQKSQIRVKQETCTQPLSSTENKPVGAGKEISPQGTNMEDRPITGMGKLMVTPDQLFANDERHEMVRAYPNEIGEQAVTLIEEAEDHKGLEIWDKAEGGEEY
ncbi:hypothetical protein NDU88_001039 [Pleurodeles waltl]|uniref:Uncharacterized protein n=1 Tax=Pleurodeles waltl TaxID=8319 RepID=A0AAV7VY03_PLEWA|nr:hypothetical protein NDU88_001039 [Pleurodeles waltl]